MYVCTCMHTNIRKTPLDRLVYKQRFGHHVTQQMALVDAFHVPTLPNPRNIIDNKLRLSPL